MATIPDYPNFVKGQVLTSQTLNGLVSYFETQDFYTRVFLLGCGIFYGLELSWNPDQGALQVSPGAGVSSDGELFPCEDIQHFSSASQQNVTLAGQSINAWVLAENGGTQSLKDLFSANNNYVILLIWDTTSTQQESCLNSYSSSPVKTTVALRVIAMTLEELAPYRAKWPVLQVANGSVSGDDPYVHRFGYQPDAAGTNVGAVINFDNFTSWDAVSTNFSAVCKAGIVTIDAAYQQAYQNLYGVLQLPAANPFANLAGTLQAILDKISGGDNPYALPYLYDYLRNLVAAYQELAATEAHRVASILPQLDRFPKYLALGSINGQADANRMGLYRPPLADLDGDSLTIPGFLLQRMIAMADQANTLFTNWAAPQSAYITPDRGLAKGLSKRAIPFYFTNRDAKLLPVWNPAITLQGRTFTIPGISADKDREMLLRDMDAYLFFRIQGHIGLNVQTAVSTLTTLRKNLHLPFDIRVVYLGTEDDLQSLITAQTAEFYDIDIWLEKIVGDIRCNNTCGEAYEDNIFKGTSRNLNYAGMLSALDAFFKGVTTDSFPQWLTEICRKLCPNGGNCCEQNVRLLWDLYQEYLRRKAALLPELLFHRFAKSHPGLEHCAGVPKGGTLVLVAAPPPATAVTFELKARFADTVNNMQNLSEGDRAQLLASMQDAGSYNVVADFCLPYVCCSKTPAVEVVFRQAPPVAKIEELDRKDNADGYTLTLKNESQNATTFQWELQDSSGNTLGTKNTNAVGDNVDFDLLYKDDVNFIVKLTASNGNASDSTTQDFNICPNGDQLQLNMDGKDEYEWTQGTDAPPLILTATPQGGTFNLGTPEGTSLNVDDYIKWNDDRKSITFNYEKLDVNQYSLSYAFNQCDRVIYFTLHVDGQTEVPKDTDAAIRAKYNKRAATLRSTVATAADSDKALAKTDKFGQTEAFLRANKNADINTRYSDLLTNLAASQGTAKKPTPQQTVQLLAQATAYYLDRQLIDSPSAASDSVKPLLQQAAKLVKANGGPAEALLSAWAPDALPSNVSADVVNTYKSLLGA